MTIKQTFLALKAVVSVSLLNAAIAPLAFVAADCAGIKTSVINCTEPNGVMGVLLLIVNILTAGVGIAAVGGIAYASVMYTTSGGSPDKVKQAKTIIMNIVVGLVAYVLLWSFLNYITPGGMFN